MHQKHVLFVFCSVIILILSGCSNNTNVSSDNSLPTDSFQMSTENIRFGNCVNGIVPSENGRGIYIPRALITFREFSEKSGVVFCTQIGCKHSDTTCTAYLDNAIAFVEYNRNLYTVRVIDGNQLHLTQIDPLSGLREIKYSVSSPENYRIQYDTCTVAYGNAYLSYTLIPLDNSLLELEQYLIQTNLSSGDSRTLLHISGASSFFFLGASQNHMVIESNYLLTEKTLLEPEEFIAQFENNANYEEYVQNFYSENAISEVIIYDLDTMHPTVLVDNKETGFRASTDPFLCYDDKIIYLSNDTLFLLDLNSLESKRLTSQKNIRTYWLMDGKAFYITGKAGDNKYFYIALDGGPEIQLNNNDNIDCMVFSILWETANEFIGLYSEQSQGVGIYSWISKFDFYTENYSAARIIG